MKIATLQFSPTLGKVTENIARANQILDRHAEDLQNVDLLVLPEMGFTGYTFPSLKSITPYLEPTAAGPSALWAKATAKRLNCTVCVGYPEVSFGAASRTVVTTSDTTATPHDTHLDNLDNLNDAPPTPFPTTIDPIPRPGTSGLYNAAIAVSATGEILAHYRKHFLYYTDTIWASPGPGFSEGVFDLPNRVSPYTNPSNEPNEPNQTTPSPTEQKRAALGICMDINPHAFTAPWSAHEFANHVLNSKADIAVVCMAWLSHELTPRDVDPAGPERREPWMESLGYWVKRFGPVVERGAVEGERGKKTILVMANRTGIEGPTCFAGSSCVMRVGAGRVEMWGCLGRAEEGCLVVDTEVEPLYELRVGEREDYEGEDEEEDEEEEIGL